MNLTGLSHNQVLMIRDALEDQLECDEDGETRKLIDHLFPRKPLSSAYKVHLVHQVPKIYPHSTRVEYEDQVVCGKSTHVDMTQVLADVTCGICRSYIEKRL